MKKEKLLEKLDMCGMLMQNLVERAEKIPTPFVKPTSTGVSFLKIDIIRLRRELNDIRAELEYDNEEG